MFYIWVKYCNALEDGGGYEPHMTFTNNEEDAARFEVRDLKDQGYRAICTTEDFLNGKRVF